MNIKEEINILENNNNEEISFMKADFLLLKINLIGPQK